MENLEMGVQKFHVTLEKRPDGGLRAFSDDVPGFMLSHPDPKAVLDDIKPALEVLISRMYGRAVEVDVISGGLKKPSDTDPALKLICKAGFVKDKLEFVTRYVAA